MLPEAELFYRFSTALGLGFLVGLQREHAHEGEQKKLLFGGVRTFPLLSLLACAAAYLAAEADSPWLLAVPLGLAGALIVAVYVVSAWRGEVGMTTEVAALLMLVIGVLCARGSLGLAVALGVTTMALLSLKMELHRLAGRVTRDDVLATLKFGIITAIVLPVLPDRTWGGPPFDVLNPRQIWLMVVLISGISFLGYLAIKMVGARQGIGLTGFLGGLVSSTAVTLSFAQRSRRRGNLARAFAVAVTIAWTMMFVRILVEVAVVNRPLLDRLWPPMVAAGAAGLAASLVLYLAQRSKDEEEMSLANPFELGPAVKFGLLYGLILLFSRAAREWLGDGGVYLSSVLAGLTDVDAITLSMAELAKPGGSVEPGLAARAVTLAAMSNTLVKGGIVLATGGVELKRALLPGFLLILAAGLATAFLPR
jgi:uncharacterized membrane protein (DUF4010 family)